MHKLEPKSDHYGLGDIPKQEANSLFLISLPLNVPYSYDLILQLFKATPTKTSVFSQNSCGFPHLFGHAHVQKARTPHLPDELQIPQV